MKDNLQNQVNKYSVKHRRKQRWLKVVSVLMAVTVFCTVYAMILPAITLENAGIRDYSKDNGYVSNLYEEENLTGEYLTDPDATDSTSSEEEVLTAGPLAVGGPLQAGPAPTTGTHTGVLLVTGSDFQEPATSGSNPRFTNQNTILTNIMDQIKAKYGNADAFIGGGDYVFDETKGNAGITSQGIASLQNTVKAEFGQNISILLVQGNHDAVVTGIATTGAHDADKYGVFVMNENDYRAYPLSSSKWGNTVSQSADLVNDLAADLETYLKGRLQNKPDQPVFICSHVPLHFSTRTVKENDAIYAKDLFDVINNYAKDLNIIFLFGHNHAWGDDDYLGGGSVFLTRGDTINIAAYGDKNKDHMTQETLNFTYMNYGYTGYIWDNWNTRYQNDNADNTLTMTSFLINGNEVEIARWDQQTVHVLKAVGTATSGGRGVSECCTVTANSVDSYQKVSDPVIGTVSGSTGIKSEWSSVLSVVKIADTKDDYKSVQKLLENRAFDLYDITLADNMTVPSSGIEVRIPVTDNLKSANENLKIFSYADGKIEWIDTEFSSDGKYLCFTATHFSEYGAGDPGDFDFPEGEGGGTYWTKITSSDEITANDNFLIVASGNIALHVTKGGTTYNPSYTIDTDTIVISNASVAGYYNISDIATGSYFNLRNSSGNCLYNTGVSRYTELSSMMLLSRETLRQTQLLSSTTMILQILQSSKQSQGQRMIIHLT